MLSKNPKNSREKNWFTYKRMRNWQDSFLTAAWNAEKTVSFRVWEKNDFILNLIYSSENHIDLAGIQVDKNN